MTEDTTLRELGNVCDLLDAVLLELGEIRHAQQPERQARKAVRAEIAELHGQQGEIVRAILSLGVNEAGIVTELAKIRAAVDTIAQAQDDQAEAAYDGELDRLIARSSHGH